MTENPLEVRVAVLETIIEKHIEDENRFWKQMQEDIQGMQSRLDELVAVKNKWLGIGISILFLITVTVSFLKGVFTK